jgi:chromosome segregation and condensation protein ScpB
MEKPTLTQKIEAFLFYEGGNASMKSLMQVTGATQDDVAAAVAALTEMYGTTRAVAVVATDTEVSLRITKECMPFIETLHKESLAKEIGPASLEVLGILLYRGKSTQTEIDTIRGVNSAFSLRTLRMRGLVSRTQEGTNVTYVPSPEALAHLGVTSLEAIPNRQEIVNALTAFEQKTQHNTDLTSDEKIEDSED